MRYYVRISGRIFADRVHDRRVCVAQVRRARLRMSILCACGVRAAFVSHTYVCVRARMGEVAGSSAGG